MYYYYFSFTLFHLYILVFQFLLCNDYFMKILVISILFVFQFSLYIDYFMKSLKEF